MSGAFDRLSGALQYQIVNTLGWRELRPVQLETIDAVLDGDNCVVLAPTAGGKTEASFFPILSAMDEHDWRPVSVIYLSPIRALLNNQEERVSHYAGLIGRRAFKWHGDVTDSALTTPESLEAMMMGTRVPTRELFAGLQAVIIDEIHAFADDDRGAHLSAVLERLSRFCGRDVQRVGLSATVGNPAEILRWAQGSSGRAARVIDPGGAKKQPVLSLDFVGNVENAATVIARLHPGKKRLVFVDSRRQAEQLGKLLSDQEVLTHVTHGSLSVTERRDAEKAFHEGSDCVIVSTSVLELGIDVGDLDHVLQLESPPSVASFLQRMGRTGRRGDTPPNCTFLCTKDSSLLQGAAILQLFREGFVEAVQPHRRASHIYAHQIMALSIQLGGVPPGDVDAWLSGATAFEGLSDAERASVVELMLREGILVLEGGRLHLGPAGEKPFGSANFRNLYAVFEAPRLITVSFHQHEVGTVDAQFLVTLCSGDTPATFTLAGKAWTVVHVEWERGRCVVAPAPQGRAARWAGSPQHLSYELCQAMKRVLMSEENDPAWSQRAVRVLETSRAEHLFLHDEALPLLEEGDDLVLWTFAGGAANVLLARMIEAELGGQVVSRNTSLTLKDEAGKSAAAVRALLAKWCEEQRPTVADARVHAEGAVRGRVSKFQGCLPEALLLDLLVTAAVDVEGARRVVG